jgi:hypothetical protein
MHAPVKMKLFLWMTMEEKILMVCEGDGCARIDVQIGLRVNPSSLYAVFLCAEGMESSGLINQSNIYLSWGKYGGVVGCVEERGKN